MRDLPPDLAAHLAGGATTLCHCWALTRRDGARLGFTDHDRDLRFGGLTYAARSGLEAAEASTELGFAIGGVTELRGDSPGLSLVPVGDVGALAEAVLTLAAKGDDSAFRSEVRRKAVDRFSLDTRGETLERVLLGIAGRDESAA